MGYEVGIVIKGTDALSPAVEKSKNALDSMSASAKSTFYSLKQHWLAVSAAMVAGWMAAMKAIDFAKLGASALQAEESYKNVTIAYGENATQLLAKMKQVSAGIIDESNLMQRAVKALQQGLSGEQIVKLLEVARTSARVAGTDIASAFDGITNAVANQMTRGLKLYGLVIDQNKAFEDYAKTLGVAKDALTEQQQSQALANAAIEEGQRQMKAMGEITENASEKIQKAGAQIHELKETIGKGLLVVLGGLTAEMYSLASATLFVVSAYEKFESMRFWLLYPEKSKEAAKEAKQFYQDAMSLAEKSADMWVLSGELVEQLISKTQNAATVTKGFAKEQLAAAAAAALHQHQQDALLKLNNEYEQWRKSIDALNPALNKETKELQKLQEEAKKFIKDGKNAADVNRELARGTNYLEAIGKVSAYREAVKGQIETVKENLTSLRDWRTYLVSSYNEAIDKAKAYQAQMQKADDIVARARQWQIDQKTKGWPLSEVYDTERKALLAGIKSAMSSTNLDEISRVIEKIQSFVGKFEGSQGISFLKYDIADLVKQQAVLIDKVSLLRAGYEDAANAWIGRSRDITTAIQTIDTQIATLDTKLRSLEVILNIDAAVQAAQYLRQEIDFFLPDIMFKTIVVNTVYTGAPAPSYQTGISYVPETGLALLHKGEEVIPANQNSYDQRKYDQKQVNQFYISGGDPKATAKEVDKILTKQAKYSRSYFAKRLN